VDDSAAFAIGMSGAKPVRLRLRRPCPICGKSSQQKFHPFCSARCADVDLNRWLGGLYAVPAEEAEDTPEAEGQS
jgi:endogenous inhibitor of DNA gyrase (YacG/DUF329 family)